MFKRMKFNWRQTVSTLLVLAMIVGLIPASVFAADTSPTYDPTGDFELNAAGVTAWSAEKEPLPVYDAETGGTQITAIPAGNSPVPFVLLEDNGGGRVLAGLVADEKGNVTAWDGGAVDGAGWVGKEHILVNLPDLLPSIAYAGDGRKQFNSRLTRFEYVFPCPYPLAEQLAAQQKSAMAEGETLVVRLDGNTVQVSQAKGDPTQFRSYSLDGTVYQKYDAWTEYDTPDSNLSVLGYELPYAIERAYSADPSVTLTQLCSWNPQVLNGPTGGVGAYNPGSPGGQRPSSTDVSWTTDPERTFLRFTLIEFPQGVVTDLNSGDYNTWHVVGTPLNVVWSKGRNGQVWSADKCRSDITWYNSQAVRFNSKGADAPQLMAGSSVEYGVYSYDATAGHNQRWVTTADEFQAETGITDEQKEQMFHCNSTAWTSGWRDGDYTSLWGTDAESVTPGNLYKVYKANDAFLYLLNRLSETDDGAGGSVSGWSKEEALTKWSEYVHDADGNLRTKYRIIVETGGIFTDPDSGCRAYTLREMMAYSLHNGESNTQYNLIWDQSSTMVNMAQWMRQAKNNQFLEYPLDESGNPTGEELHSTNGFTECDSFVDSIEYSRPIRDTIFSERRSFGLHIFSPFNFEVTAPNNPSLDVTKKIGSGMSADEEWGITVTYTSGTASGFIATKNDVDCTDEVTSTGNGLRFSLKANETVHIEFDADQDFRFEVTEDDSSKLTGITGTGGNADMAAKKFTSSGGASKVTFTNGTTAGKKPVYLKLKKISKEDKKPLSGAVFSVYADASCSGTALAAMTTGSDGTASTSVPDIVEDGGSVTLYVKETTAPAGCTPLSTPFTVTCQAPDNTTQAGAVQVGPAAGIENEGIPDPEPGKAILYKRDANTNAGVGPATFRFSSVTNGDYEFDTDASGTLETIQWYDPTEADGKYIKPGEYAVSEIVPPPNYLPTKEVQQIKLELDADGNPIPAGPLVFKNHAKVGLRIVKYDRQSHSPMNGVTFEIFKDGASMGRYETKGGGEIVLTDLVPGTYRAVEIDTGDDSHLLDSCYQEVELTAGGGTKELFFFNDSKPGMKLVKVDSANPAKPISGAKFSIEAVDGSYGPQEFTTNGSGEIDLSGLPTGSYVVTELECAGYVIDDAQRIIHLKANDDAEFVFTNTMKPSFRLVKTSADGTPLDGVTFRIARIEDGARYLDRTTENGGEILVEDLDPGVYSVVETATLPDHILDTTEYHVELSPGKTSELRLSNAKKPGLRLIKTSADGTPLDGVTFKITKIEDASHSIDRTTQNGGEILVENLDPGVYSVVETATLPDHILDQTEHHVELSPGKTSEIRLSNDKRPSLVISKTDKDTGEPVPGVTFTLRGADGPTITTKPTGTDGKITITNLLPGVYTVTEQSVPENYILDTTPQTVTLFPNKEAQVEFQNYQRPTLKIVKVDIAGKHLTGAIFTVTTKAGVKIGDFPVGADGTIEIPKKHLTEGYYIITEKQAPAGYILDTTPHEVYLRPGKTTEVSIENEKKPGLTIYKVDSIVGDGIKGAKFEIWVSKDKNQNGTYQQLTSSYYYTDANGIIHLDNLDTGWYKIIEVEPPSGFMLKDPSEQTIYVEHDTSVEVTFENIPKSALVIRKIDSDTGAPLANAWFRVRYLGGTSGSGGTIIGEYQTSSNGNIVITGLDAGTYVCEEISAPHGYVMDTAPQTAYISGKEQDCITLTYTNSKYGSVLIKKVDGVTGEPLSDIQFYITTSDGAVVGSSNGYFVTDSAGTILISDIMPGTTLVVRETRTRPGYILDEVPQTVKITSNETKTLEFRNQPAGALLIRKVCSVNPSVTLANAEFKVAYSDGTLIGDSSGVYRSDENGEVRIEGLTPGKSVVITETKAPAGFLIDTQSQTVVIQAGKTVSVTMKNQPKGAIVIQKRDSDTGQPLSGAEFRVTTAAGCEVGLDGVIGTSTLTQNGLFTTDSNGEIRISNLAPGAYVLTETKAPAGYVMDAPSTNVVIGANGDTQTVVITNTRKGGLIIEKYDSVTRQPLAGAQFRVTTASGELVPDNEGMTSSNGLYTTNAEGQIVLSKLLPGTYIVTETKAPDNYRQDPTPQTVVVRAGDTQTVRYYDDPLCTLTILKRDAVTKKPLKGAEFLVRYSSGHVVGPDNGLYTTGGDGTVTVSGLEPNATVVVSEYKAPTGYIKNSTPKNIVVRTGTANSLIFENEPGTMLVIRKYIEGTENEPLSGVAFKVVDGSGAAVGPDDGVYFTDKAGEIVLDGIEPGTTVTAREIKTVDGFVLDGTPQDILIKAGEVQNLTFWNKRAGTLLIEKLDSVTKAPLAGAQFKVLYADGRVVDTEGGKLSSNGIYITDQNGQIKITQVTGTLVITEEKAPDGYVMDPNGKSQTVIVNPNDTQTIRFYNEPLCSLTLTKQDSVTGKPVPNTEFTVRDGDGNILGRYTTGEDGTVTATGFLPNSTVVVSESRVPNGYVLNTTPQTIIVRNGSGNSWVSGGSEISYGSANGIGANSSSGGNQLDFENDPKMTLTIRKYIEGTQNEPLAGVAFKVADSSGTPVGSGDGVFYTNDAGEIAIEGLEPGTTITAREIKTVDGFVLDGTPKTVKIKADQTAPALTFWNKRAGVLVIQKKDAVTGNFIAGAQFQLTYANGGYVDNSNGHLSSNGLYTTNDKGEIRISGVTGTIVAKEVKAAPGYVIDQSTQTQTVTVNPEDTQTLVFLNAPLCSLTLTKLDSVTGKPVSGTEFTVKDGSGNVVGRYTTGKDGTAVVTGLIPGAAYVVTETRVPNGYVLNSVPQTITVKNGTGNSFIIGGTGNSGNIGSGDGNDLVFENDPKTTLVIQKFVDGTDNEPLAGVEFLVTDSSGAVVGPNNGYYITDKDGRIIIEGLEPGVTITARETKTLDGFILDGTPQSIKIKAGEAQTVTFWNKKAGGLIINKIDALTKEPLAGVKFKITYADGSNVDLNGGKISSNGLYSTNSEGQIVIPGITGTILVTELETLDGYVIDPDARSQTVTVNPNDTQTITFENMPVGGLELIKVSEADKSQRIPNTIFEIRKMDGSLVETVTTNKRGQVHVNLDAGDYYAVEIEAAEGYKLDATPHYFTVEDGRTTTLTVTNAPFSGIIIHKVDSVTGDGIYDVKFLVYDQNKNPIGEYATDNEGYIYIDNLTVQGKGLLYIRELEAAPGYELDKEYKTVYVQPGKTVEVEWENTPITGQIQVMKYAGEYNEVTGTPAGTPLQGAVYEISDPRSNKVVDYITTDARGIAASKPLPLGRYKIVEVTAPAYWQLSGTVFDETLEYSGQIIKVSDYDKPSNLGVTITKRGNAEALAGSQMRYDFTVANTSNVPLDSFYWHERVPTDAARATVFTTGTYSARLNYRILYKTNYSAAYQVLASNLLTSSNYSFSLNAIPTQAGEYVTDIYLDFGKVPVGFQSTSSPTLTVQILGTIANGYQLVNRADAGGKYQGTWQTAQASWTTLIRKLTPNPTLPKTGY